MASDHTPTSPTPRSRIPGSRMALAITCIIVTAVVVAGSLAGALPGRNRVQRDDIARGAVVTRHIANNTIRSADIRDGQVTSSDIAQGGIDISNLSDDLRPRYARIEYTGGTAPTSAQLLAGSGVADWSRVAEGIYRVQFDTDVRPCGWTTSRNDAAAGAVRPGLIGSELASTAEPDTLWIRTWDTDGTADDLEIGDAFTVTVTCAR